MVMIMIEMKLNKDCWGHVWVVGTLDYVKIVGQNGHCPLDSVQWTPYWRIDVIIYLQTVIAMHCLISWNLNYIVCLAYELPWLTLLVW